MVKAEVAPGAGSGGPAFLGPELGSCIVPSTPSGLRVGGLRHTRFLHCVWLRLGELARHTSDL